MLHQGTCKLLNLVVSELVDEDYVQNNRNHSVSALIYGTTALLSKPGQVCCGVEAPTNKLTFVQISHCRPLRRWLVRGSSPAACAISYSVRTRRWPSTPPPSAQTPISRTCSSRCSCTSPSSVRRCSSTAGANTRSRDRTSNRKVV